jgi:hypothetical protein
MMFIKQAKAEECDTYVLQKLGCALKILDRKRYVAKCYTM